MDAAKKTVGVAAVAAGAKLATSYDQRMFLKDNMFNLLIWAGGSVPKIIAAKSDVKLRKMDQEQIHQMNKSFPIDKTAKKAHYAVETVQVPVDGAEIEVKIFTPEQAATGTLLPLIIWYHGGGMVFFDHNDPFLGDDFPLGFGFLEYFQGKAVVATVDYRLAPEHPFPTGVNDAIAAMRFLHANAGRWGVDPARVSVAGYSAGAYCTAVVSQAARNEGIPLCAAFHIAPMLRFGATTESHMENGNVPALTSSTMLWFWRTYCPDRSATEDPMCEPVRGIGAGGMAPSLVITNEFDVLRDEGVEYFEALRQAGVPAEHVRCRSSHLGPAFDKERMNVALSWWSEALGLTSSRL